CGNCKPVCPVFLELGEEAASPRGRVRLIRGVSRGEVELSARYRELVGICLNCRACTDECPSGIEPNAAVLTARRHLTLEKGLPLIKRAIFRGAMRARRVFPASAKLLGALQRISLIGNPHNPLRWTFPLVGLPRDKAIPYFQLKTFLDRVPEVMPVENRKHRVAYFVGCGANLLMPEIGEAVVGLLNHFGVEVVIPHRQMCCGTPVFNSGDFGGGAYLAKQNIRTFGRLDVDAIIVGCGSCGLAWKHEWRDLLGLDVPENLSAKVYDITEFLTDCLGVTEIEPHHASRITHHSSLTTYHDPCHLARGLGVRDQPRRLLGSVPGVELVEMAEADTCCGAAGAFSIYHPDLSRKVGVRKAANVVGTGAEIIATGCPVCVIQLREMLARAGSSQSVAHTACVLWEAVRTDRMSDK
ncbi:MAG: (Fe-S)-binding protein, partial [Armatimonadetes bacterium]|nr:(Fe-S)-binding protein [Armatimonadota bacterium]